MEDFTPTPARNTSPDPPGFTPGSPETGLAAPGEYETWDDYFRDDLRAFQTARGLEEARKAEEADRGLKALMLAPTLELCRALLRGERLPWGQLSFFQAKRYGIKRGRRHPDGRYGLDDFNDRRAPE